MATSPETTLPFFPVTQSDWRTFAFPLSQVLPPDVNNNIPKSYELFQNFPNPFNPKTTIRYQIPSTAFVKLKIYDLLGREIQTLVNEQKQRGVYDVLFDGSNLSSGIYFCVLKVNDFIGVKKIALIK